MGKMWDSIQISFKVPPTSYELIDAAAEELGITRGEYLRGCFDWEINLESGAPELKLRKPTKDNIGIVGANGWVVGSLMQVAAGEAWAYSEKAPGRWTIVADIADIVVLADGSFFPALSATRKVRKPGRRNAVRAERVRDVAEFSGL